MLLYVIFTHRRNNYFGFGIMIRILTCKKFWVRAGPDPQHCLYRLYLKLINTVYDRFCDIKCFPTKEE